MFTVARELEADDYRAFAAYVAKTARGPGPAWGLMVLALLAAAAYGLFLLVGWDVDLPTCLATFAVVLFWAIIVGRAHGRAVAPAEDGLLLEPSELVVDDDGIRDRGPRAESLFRWPAVRQVAVTDRHIFVMFDRVLGLIVPRYCFADEAAENEFLREVRRRCPESAEWTVADRAER
jgi:YcxB-like protein